MRSLFVWLGVLLLLPCALAAQQFTGRGQQATALFPLAEGLSVFEVEHRAESGDFVVRLLDEQGQVVEELARGTGRFGGSKAVRVPRSGQYLLDVLATGPWSVRRRAADAAAGPEIDSPAYQQGQEAGMAAAPGAGAGWLARGLAGGLLAGPLGAGVAVGMASRSDVPLPAPPADGAPLDLAYQDGYQQGFEQRVRANRKRMAFVGGMVGTGVFVFALIQALDIAGSGEGGGTGNPGQGPGTGFARLPR